jgi:hypothetical protein
MAEDHHLLLLLPFCLGYIQSLKIDGSYFLAQELGNASLYDYDKDIEFIGTKRRRLHHIPIRTIGIDLALRHFPDISCMTLQGP